MSGTFYTAIGLMSGTSLDGVDAACMITDGQNHIQFVASAYLPYQKAFKEQLHQLARGDLALNTVLRLERQLSHVHAEAVELLLNDAGLKREKVDVIGFHGQTIRHLPEEGLTWQLGDPSYLAQTSLIPVVADFRRRDMAAGGQGAPFIPLFHQALFAGQPLPCAVLNIGGVANITYFGKDGSLIAGDTGPGMGLLDVWAQQHGAPKGYDENGTLALAGKADADLVRRALHMPFFSKPFPKSADRYDFDAVDVSHLSAADGAATLALLTAEAVLNSFKFLPEPPQKLWLTGGGAQNPAVRKNLAQKVAVGLVEELGLRGDSMEAECFAWLAVRRLLGLPLSVPGTTGCKTKTVGGTLTF